MAKKKEGLIDLRKISKAEYNPRTMGVRNKEALRASIKNFSDISGIVVNERTGNILAGNHRWVELCGLYGEKNLTIEHLGGEFHQILSKDGPTGFIMRVVDWDLEKEKAANIAANSNLIQGEFTSGLQEILLEIQDSMGAEFEELRFDELSIDFGDLESMGNQGISDPESVSDKIRKNAEDENIMLDTDDQQPGEVKVLKTSIKLVVPGDKVDMIREDVIEFLNKRPYGDEVEIH